MSLPWNSVFKQSFMSDPDSEHVSMFFLPSSISYLIVCFALSLLSDPDSPRHCCTQVSLSEDIKQVVIHSSKSCCLKSMISIWAVSNLISSSVWSRVLNSCLSSSFWISIHSSFVAPESMQVFIASILASWAAFSSSFLIWISS